MARDRTAEYWTTLDEDAADCSQIGPGCPIQLKDVSKSGRGDCFAYFYVFVVLFGVSASRFVSSPLCNNLGQVIHSRQSPSGIIRYWPKSAALRLRKVIARLAENNDSRGL